MIYENELYELLNRKVPEIRRDINCSGETGCPYKMAAFFAAYTKSLGNSGEHERMRQCLELAEDILQNGNNGVRNAIENVYLFSISRNINSKFIYEFPLLKKEHKKQVYASCI